MAPPVALRGRTVAVVGRAASLVGRGEGEAIDSRDVVIRVNAMLPLEAGSPDDRGTRTDILYHAKMATEERDAARKAGVPAQKRHAKLRARLAWEREGYRPFTGTVAVFWALIQGAVEVYATGMDLYRGSGALGRPGGELDWENWSHDPAGDVRLLRRLRDHCDRLRVWAPLAEILEDAR
ncbi:MAG: glycosyltransferase family 29 protein [Myxococcota bacterium]